MNVTVGYLIYAVIVSALGTSGGSAKQLDDVGEFFEKKIRPILSENCYACHNPVVLEAGLDLTTVEGFRKNAIISPANLEHSRLLQVIGYEDRIKMPPSGRLRSEEIDALRTWVLSGAQWSGFESAGQRLLEDNDDTPSNKHFTEEESSYWAFLPLRQDSPPKVNENWSTSEIDRFLVQKINKHGLEPALPAGKLTLLRRVTYDLTGLPPTIEEISDFLKDDSPSAYKRVVERLLSSPRYGERWGRHWLDLARYADSTGNDEDHRYPHGWRYRDYVISAFNEDLPYNQFVHEQIAGDLLPPVEGQVINRRGIIATGLLSLGPKALAQQDKKKMLYDVYDEQLDVVSKTFLGLTVTCARCHDHKFDPIPTRDYYSMVGIFARTRSFKDSTTHVAKLLERPLVSDEVYEVYRLAQNRILHKKADIEHAIDLELATRNERLLPSMDSYMVAAERVYGSNEQVAEVAVALGLDLTLLEKWVEYLTPRDILRPHLADWHGASGEQRIIQAIGYRDRNLTRVKNWNDSIRKRWELVQALRPEMEEAPFARPEVLEGTDRFFYDVHFHKDGPMSVSEKGEGQEFSSKTLTVLRSLRSEFDELEANLPVQPPMASAVAEGELIAQHVFVRGDHRNSGELAPLGFLSVLDVKDVNLSSDGSGRLELAEWITEVVQPLTARVMVNRVWQWHFGQGLVRTASNFGTMGELPSHPRLLDYLAQRFIEDGWSVKTLHRRILHSSAYRMSTDVSAKSVEVDPENRLLSHFNRRRLDVEEIRDGLLVIDASIDFTMGGTLDGGTGTDLENSNGRLSLDPSTVRRRTVYLPLRRANLPGLLNLFDFGDAVNSMPKRINTTVPSQALFMMNSEFVSNSAINLARKVLRETHLDAQRRVERIYLSILSRMPTRDELGSASAYLSRLENRFRGPGAELNAWQSLCKILISSNEFIYLD